MFTGIIQGQAELAAINRLGTEVRIRFVPLFRLDNIQLGESIAANGICLTVESADARSYTAFASAETIQVSNLGAWKTGGRVNIERALALGDRLGGHIVSGHVDALATVREVKKVGLATRYRLTFPSEHAGEVVAKGSVALDGISLTVNACGPDFLEVGIIPETRKITSITEWKPGYQANLETDMLGKYVKRLLSAYLSPDAGGQVRKPGSVNSRTTGSTGLSLEFLRENGF